MIAHRYLMAVALSALLAAPIGVAQAKSSTATPAATTTQSSTSTSKKGGMIDLNTASAQELDTLPGIGKKRAQAIIDHRPYKTKDELVEKKIVPQSVYNEIKDRVVARRGASTSGSGSSSHRSSTTKKSQ